MGQKKTTTSNSTSTQNALRNSSFNRARQFDPTSMAAFESLTPAGAGGLLDLINDPRKSVAFNENLASTNRMLGGLASRNMGNWTANQAALGAAPDPLRNAEMISQIGRQSSGAQANAFLGLLSQANAMRGNAITSALGYNPLQIGESGEEESTEAIKRTGKDVTEEKTGGLGTWLPQVIGMGLGAVTGGMTGGWSPTNILGGAMGQKPSAASASPGAISGAWTNPRYQPQQFQQPNFLPTQNPWLYSGGR